MKMKWFLAGAVGVALLQTVALGKMIYDRGTLMQSGQEVVLQSAMVDPRDLFRGHYVTLNLTVGALEDGSVDVFGELKDGEPVYVELMKGEDEFWIAKTLFADYPNNNDGPVIKGDLLSSRLDSGSGLPRYRIRFPFDRFFADKTRAKDLEKVRSDRKLGVVLSVGSDGGGVIKGISVDGELIYIEPLW